MYTIFQVTMVRTYGANHGSLGGVFAQNKVKITFLHPVGFVLFKTRVARFFWCNIPKWRKDTTYTKCPQNIPDVQECSKLFNSKAFQNLSELGFLGMKKCHLATLFKTVFTDTILM
jgi:hypothetical protein